MNSITMEELKRLIPNVRLIDIRDKFEYNQGSISTAINVPMQFLLTNPDVYIDKNNKYYIFCESGFRSTRAVSFLNSVGYNTINVLGGYKEYRHINKKL